MGLMLEVWVVGGDQDGAKIGHFLERVMAKRIPRLWAPTTFGRGGEVVFEGTTMDGGQSA